LKEAVCLAEKSGIILGFETMETEFMNTVEKAMKYVTLVDSAYLSVYPDIGNLTNAAVTYKTDVLEDLYLGKGHLAAMHLKETVPGKFREIPFGTGHVDFEAAIQAAWELGVRKFVAEFWYVGNPDWKEDLKSAHDRFATLLNQR
ncbi:MAG: TIM barrel protein, partial [Acetivibrio ethanolgignens]